MRPAALEERLRVDQALRSELDRYRVEMKHLIASLGVVHGQLVHMSASDDTREDVAAQVRELRARVSVLAANGIDGER